MAIVPEREAPWQPDEGQYISGSAYGGYFPEAMPTGLVPPWERLDPELERLEEEGQQLRAENKARIERLESNDWLVPAEKAKLVSGELTEEQAAEMGQYRKRMFTEAKAMRDEAKRPKTGRERFIKTVINNPMFGGIDPRFIDRQKAKKELKGVKLAEYKKAHQESFDKDATGSTLFKMMVVSTKEADQEIDSKTDKRITILGNLIKHYDGQQKARVEAVQKQREAAFTHRRAIQMAVVKEQMIRGRELKPETRTTLQKNYTAFQAQKPDYKGSLVDFKKALAEKDPLQLVLSLAGRDFRVMSGQKTLGDVAMEYMDAITTLKGGTTAKKRERKIVGGTMFERHEDNKWYPVQ